VLGVADDSLVEKLALALQHLGCKHALVVHGEDGLDEITVSGKTHICELKGNHIVNYTISPEDIGLTSADSDTLKGGSARENAEMLRNILAGASGPQRDAVLMNTAAVLLAGDKIETLRRGVELAQRTVDSGQALDKLEQLTKLSQNLS
jgi:anthranilate phosphoribosyltransferase